MTKKVLLDTIVAQKDDPTFLSKVIKESFDALPENLSAYLARQLYIQYAHEGTYYKVYHRIHQTVEYFLSVTEIHKLIAERYPETSLHSVYTAIKRGHALHHHVITKKEPKD